MLPETGRDGPEILDAILPVSRETIDRLETFVALVQKWQPAENLIAPSTLPFIWRRHVADSVQLVALFPLILRWVDLGSGAGFPGVVLACLLAENSGRPSPPGGKQCPEVCVSQASRSGDGFAGHCPPGTDRRCPGRVERAG